STYTIFFIKKEKKEKRKKKNTWSVANWYVKREESSEKSMLASLRTERSRHSILESTALVTQAGSRSWLLDSELRVFAHGHLVLCTRDRNSDRWSTTKRDKLDQKEYNYKITDRPHCLR